MAERDDEILELLRRIERNQQAALQVQREQLALAASQLERSGRSIDESLALQRVAVARQAQVRNVALPLILALVGLLVYLVLKWRIL